MEAQNATRSSKIGPVAAQEPDSESDEPVGFPNEIFAMIGGYFDPGTKSLFNLARTCRSLYELLLLRLYKTFSLNWDLVRMPRPSHFYSRRESVPSGLTAIHRLEAHMPLLAELAQMDIVELCPKCRRARLQLEIFRKPRQNERGETIFGGA